MLMLANVVVVSAEFSLLASRATLLVQGSVWGLYFIFTFVLITY